MSRMIRRRIRCLLLACLILFPVRFSLGEEVSATQYELKAVFLYNFTQFVEWPAEVFRSPDAPFIIGIYGPNVFGSHLEEAVRGEKVNGHPIRIVLISTPADAGQCHLLFINKTKAAEFSTINSYLKRHSILTVSDAPAFCKAGGMVGFIDDRNKIKLQINTEAAAGADLKISSKLLRLAELVASKS
jgi:hypothetical protein